MTEPLPTTPDGTGRRPTHDESLSAALAVPIVGLFALWAISFPAAALAVLAGVVVAVTVLTTLAVAARLTGQPGRLPVPGLGTLELRLRPR